jgi:hypothetical protein
VPFIAVLLLGLGETTFYVVHLFGGGSATFHKITTYTVNSVFTLRLARLILS